MLENKEFKRYTITAALPYANGPKHIGHLAGAYIPADVYVRYLRLIGSDVIFVCGSDEHGTAIPNQALLEGTTVKAIIDKYHCQIRDCLYSMGISFDIYHRTSEEIHHQTSQEFFLNLYNKGKFEEQTLDQYFDEKANVFLADRYIIGTCPNCNHENAYGDQCEKCGSTLSPQELINPRSTLSGDAPIIKPSKHWYLPLNEYETWLREWILVSHSKDWKTNVYGQCKSWIEAGLQSRAMTRDLDWGISVPLENAKGKVLYVWFDAPIGYVSATRALFDEISSGKFKYATPQSEFKNTKKEDWKKYWQDDETKLVHFIGKDNIVFHCIIFPAILKATGEYIIPSNIPANEFMNLEDDKMSTSRKWSIEMIDYLEDFPNKQDELRYTLLANLPETKDSEFTWKDFQTKNNSELVAIFGNFVNRVFVLLEKLSDGVVPSCDVLEEIDNKLYHDINLFPKKIGDSIQSYRFRESVALMMEIARTGNKYLTETEPWKLDSKNNKRISTILNLSIQVVANLAIMSEPFLPFTSKKLKDALQLKDNNWKIAGSMSIIKPGTKLKKVALLFEKIEDQVINSQIKKLKDTKMEFEDNSLETKQIAPIKPTIPFDDFKKLDLRVGTVVSAENVENSNKLLKLTIDSGLGERTILSGIATHYKAEAMVGRQVVFIANIEVRKMMGIESHGMILSVEDENKLILLSPTEKVRQGSSVG